MTADYHGAPAPVRRLQLLQVLASTDCEHNPVEFVVDALAAREIDASTRDVLADADWLAARRLVGISYAAGGLALLSLSPPGLEIVLGLARHPAIASAEPSSPDSGGPGCAAMTEYHRWRTGQTAPLVPGRRYEFDLGGGVALSIRPDRPLEPETLDALREICRAAVDALTRPAGPDAATVDAARADGRTRMRPDGSRFEAGS